MTTSAAENLAGRDKDKEKVEKRRALGRGLESLLPGPRVVPNQGLGARGQGPAAAAPAATYPPFAKDAKDGAPTAREDQGKPPVPPTAGGVGAAGQVGYPIEGTIRAVVEDGAEAPDHFASASAYPPFADSAKDGAPASVVDRGTSPLLPTAGRNGAHPFDSSLTSGSDEPITIYAQAETRVPGNLVVNLGLELIDKNPFQTRYVDDNDTLEELAESIKANGVVQPILVRPSEDEAGRYILVLGERRLHASKKAGKKTVPAMVRKLSLQQAAEMTIIENLQREDLSALEQAEAFRILSKDFQLTQAQIGERVGLSRESVTNYMRLLKLPREVMQMLAEKRISFGQAKELLKLNGEDQISQAAIYLVKKGLSLEQVERMVLSMNGLLDPFPGMPGRVVKKTGGARWVDPNVRAAQTELERLLGCRVRIRDRKGKGKIVIEYATVDDYDRVVEMLRGK